MTASSPELIACTPSAVDPAGFNSAGVLPHGLTTGAIGSAMTDFLDFLGFINNRLHLAQIPRLESIMMSANFSSLVGEFMNTRIPQHCSSIVKNKYHNGHPDLVPAGVFPGDAVQHSTNGVEIKASRYGRGWQGHNAEDIWLMVFVYESNRVKDGPLNPIPFQFLSVFGAQLLKSDWLFAGRSATSRRTITASVTPAGFAKMSANWIYKIPGAPPIVSPPQTSPSVGPR